MGTLLLNQLIFIVACFVIPALLASALGLIVAAGVNFAIMHHLVFRRPGTPDTTNLSEGR